MGGFVELHARSAFSFLRGASQPEDLVVRAGELGLEGLAVTDRDGFYGSARVRYATAEEGGVLNDIIGTEITMECGSVVPVLVAQRKGYQQLCRLLTTAKLRSPKGESRCTWDELAQAAEEAGRGALRALTGDADGAVVSALLKKDPAAANAHTQRLKDIFGASHVAVEISRHSERSDTYTNSHLADLAEAQRLPLVATAAPLYARQQDRMLADAFACLREHTTLDKAGRLLAANSQRHLKSAAQIRALFPDLPQAVTNTSIFAEPLEFTLADLGYEFPKFPTEPGESMDSVLRAEAYAGAARRYTKSSIGKAHKLLEKELAVISKLGFSGYFLLVWDIVCSARELGIMVQGRGSAANSVVCFALGLTVADPVKHGLLFERFLTENRASWPDIDLDLPSGDLREKVIQHVYNKYTPRGAAMVANVITYRGRSALREMGKVLGIPEDVLDRFSKLNSHGDFPSTLEFNDHLRKSGPARWPPARPRFRQPLPRRLRNAPPSRTTLWRHGHFRSPARHRRPARECLHARARRPPVGQRRLRRPRYHQSRSPRARHDGRHPRYRRTLPLPRKPPRLRSR